MPIPGNNLRDNMFVPVLAKCPWCKANAIVEDHGDNGWYIGCKNDECEIQPSFWADDELQAARMWNTCKDEYDQGGIYVRSSGL